MHALWLVWGSRTRSRLGSLQTVWLIQPQELLPYAELKTTNLFLPLPASLSADIRGSAAPTPGFWSKTAGVTGFTLPGKQGVVTGTEACS